MWKQRNALDKGAISIDWNDLTVLSYPKYATFSSRCAEVYPVWYIENQSRHPYESISSIRNLRTEKFNPIIWQEYRVYNATNPSLKRCKHGNNSCYWRLMIFSMTGFVASTRSALNSTWLNTNIFCFGNHSKRPLNLVMIIFSDRQKL